MIARYVIALLATIALATPAWTQSERGNWKYCGDTNPDVSIRGCTAIIDSGNEKPRRLALAYFNRGEAYSIKRQYEASLPDYDAALQLEPSYGRSAILRFNRGFAYWRQGDNESALADFNQVVVLQPNFPVYSNLGDVYNANGDYDHAIASFNKGLLLYPGDLNALIGRGTSYLNKGEYDRSIADYNQAILLKPSYAGGFVFRCFARAIVGHLDEALADCNHANELSAFDSNASGYRAFTYLKMGQYDLAITDYNVGLLTYRDMDTEKYSEWLYGRGLAKQRTGDAKGAASDFAEARQINAGVGDELKKKGVVEKASSSNLMLPPEPAGPGEAINAAAVLLGTENVHLLRKNGPGAILISKEYPVRLQLKAPVLPITDKPPAHVYTGAASKGKWDVAGSNGLIFAGGEDNTGNWHLSTGELQFSGIVGVGSYFVVFLSGEIESTGLDGGICTDGSVAQVDGVNYELIGKVWSLKK